MTWPTHCFQEHSQLKRRQTALGSNLWCDGMTQPLTSGTPERDMEETVLTPKDSVCSRRHGLVLGSPSMIEKTPAPALNETSSDGDNRSHRCLNQQQHFPELMTVCFSGAFICFHLCLWLAFQRICSPSLLLWKLFQK